MKGCRLWHSPEEAPPPAHAIEERVTEKTKGVVTMAGAMHQQRWAGKQVTVFHQRQAVLAGLFELRAVDELRCFSGTVRSALRRTVRVDDSDTDASRPVFLDEICCTRPVR